MPGRCSAAYCNHTSLYEQGLPASGRQMKNKLIESSFKGNSSPPNTRPAMHLSLISKSALVKPITNTITHDYFVSDM
jgi:hypothetical protein